MWQRVFGMLGFKYRGKQVCEVGLMAGESGTGLTDYPDCGRADRDTLTLKPSCYTLQSTTQSCRRLQMPADWSCLKSNSGSEPSWQPDIASLQLEEILANYWRESIGVTLRLRYNDAS